MTRLLWLIIVAAALWSGYWFVGAEGSKAALASWFDERRSEGWQVELAEHDVRGFPNRFDTTLTDVNLTDPDTGLSWRAPFFQLFTLSYKPNHLIAIWPNTQTIATPYETIDIATSTMTASLVVKPSANVDLSRANVVVEAAQVNSSDGWSAGFDMLNAAIRETEGTALSYDVAVQADQMIPGAALRDLLDRGGRMPDRIEELRLDLVVGVSEPLSRQTIETRRPDITKLKVNEARGLWGGLELRLAGDLDVDADGFPTGDMAVSARNWRKMIQLAVTAGALNSDLAAGLETGLGFLARTSGAENSLDVTVSFRNRGAFIGPLPIGPAPQIKLR